MKVDGRGDIANNACGCRTCQGSKDASLKREFEAICMKDGESIDDFAMKLTTIVSDICLLDDKVEEISVVKKFL